MDILCLGELLVDMIAEETGKLSDIKSFRKYPGGAAANVAVGVTKLGLSAVFLGRVSNDGFGDFLVNTLESYGVHSTGMVRDDKRKTTIAFIALDENKKPSYLFYRDDSASSHLSPQDLKEELFTDAKFLYFSSISLANSPILEANYEAVRLAHKYGCMVAFDPNVRLNIWPSKEKAWNEIHKMLSNVDILKINDDELRFLFGEGDTEELCIGIFKKYPQINLIALTLGEKGCFLMSSPHSSLYVNATASPVVDTTGAGDSFMSALLTFLVQHNGIRGKEDLARLGVFANSAAHLTAQRPGAIPALPSMEDIENFINNRNQ